MKRNPLLELARSRIKENIKREIDLSFEIADRIYEVLRKRKWSQKKLATLCGKHESEVSRWLSGGHNFTIQTIALIESKLGERIVEVTGKSFASQKTIILKTDDFTSVKSNWGRRPIEVTPSTLQLNFSGPQGFTLKDD